MTARQRERKDEGGVDVTGQSSLRGRGRLALDFGSDRNAYRSSESTCAAKNHLEQVSEPIAKFSTSFKSFGDSREKGLPTLK